MRWTDPTKSLKRAGHSGEGTRRSPGSPPRPKSKAQRVLEAEDTQAALHSFFQAGWVPFGPLGKALRIWGNSVWMKSSCFLHSSPNYPCMKSDAQLSLGIFSAVSLSALLSLCLISCARLILSLFLWVLQQQNWLLFSKESCSLIQTLVTDCFFLLLDTTRLILSLAKAAKFWIS